jgi:hypothetical protein
LKSTIISPSDETTIPQTLAEWMMCGVWIWFADTFCGIGFDLLLTIYQV